MIGGGGDLCRSTALLAAPESPAGPGGLGCEAAVVLGDFNILTSGIGQLRLSWLS